MKMPCDEFDSYEQYLEWREDKAREYAEEGYSETPVGVKQAQENFKKAYEQAIAAIRGLKKEEAPF